ncbi:RNA polymerase sigma factor [Cytobacillus oceanisediminis]|uniref:RNA polymerase sigma factor n=2 Tax=Niallia TaxID=2837506 RepID=A0A941GIF7_NIACI|nr:MULTISPECIES: RNA polymerase sigma factor [Bacillaceae]EOR27205.1 DNA-directed RNA polymerase specialized sigma subunit [Niallia nealsonii AAU1]MDU1846297.1 RNA polymerase sigma factor [Niallia nealsonii]MBZ9533537.1 RNA polymerase sigma factor [Cytobacillus oceanisediminis]MCB5239678.1 RNA polymerase sigma factor [Niallia circulans]MED3794817.1 RNA polymerase sigma factor [Niallia alba]
MFDITGFNEKEIYELFFEKVYKTTFYILKNEELAKDATHDTFIKVLKNLGKINNHSKLSAWITTIATRTAIDIYNKNKRQSAQLFEEENYVLNTYEFNYEKDEIEYYLANLPPEQKQVLILKYMDDLSEREIAKLLSIKLGTVKSRIYRAKQKMYRQYQSGGESKVEE